MGELPVEHAGDAAARHHEIAQPEVAVDQGPADLRGPVLLEPAEGSFEGGGLDSQRAIARMPVRVLVRARRVDECGHVHRMDPGEVPAQLSHEVLSPALLGKRAQQPRRQ